MSFRKKLLNERANALAQIERIGRRENNEEYMAAYRAEFEYLIMQWEEVLIDIEKRLVRECEFCGGTVVPADLGDLHYHPDLMCRCN